MRARFNDQLDVVEMGVVTDDELERGIQLAVMPKGFVALDQHRARRAAVEFW